MKHSVSDAGDLRKYFAAIPNIVFTLGLNPYELVLYCYLKKVAGESGTCWKSTATIARDLPMGAGTVSRTKGSLAAPRAALNGKALISITAKMLNGGHPSHAITITDIWPENMAELERVSTRSTQSERVPDGKATRSTQEGTRSTGEGTRSTHDYKEEPKKKNKEEKPKEELLPPFLTDRFLSALADFEQHRKEIGRPLKSMGRKQIYKQLREMGESRAVVAIEYSIAKGWQGVFEPKEKGNGANYQRPVTASDRRNEALKKNLAYIAELRGEGSGDSNEGVGGDFIDVGGRRV